MKTAFAAFAFAARALAIARTSAPSGCVTVATSGGDYDSIQKAVDSLSSGGCIFLDEGIYSEQVFIDSSAKLTIYGYTSDTSSYSGNKATITSSLSQEDNLTNDLTGTLRVHSANFKLYNVNVENGFGEGSQAVALSAHADSGYYGCSFTGFQDTVLANKGNQLYSNCYIEGATDFIFGQLATAWFEACDIGVLAKPKGFITANGRKASSDPSYYVFNNCDVAAAPGASVTAGAYFLGRPWGAFARVVFQNSALSNVVNSKGWSIWNKGDERTGGVKFGEFGNSGDGTEGTRATFSSTLKSAVSIETVLGDSYTSAGYYDATYM